MQEDYSMKEAKYYNNVFFVNHLHEPYQSAQAMVPLLYETFKPSSVVDFGCGVGNWLKVWKESTPVKDLLGIEGPYIKKELYKIPEEMIMLTDLKNKVELGRKFDLVISLEVAEHLPHESAETFVSSLVAAGDVVVFSAAIKGQLGTYHINEQYPEYWAAIFKKFGYEVVDYLRPMIWNNQSIEYWYRQNVLIFIKPEVLHNYPVLLPYHKVSNPEYLLRIHPEQFNLKLELINRTSTIFGFMHWRLYLLKVYVKKLFNIK